MNMFEFIDNFLVSHGAEDTQVTVGSHGHLILNDVKFRDQIETFLCAGAAAATVGGGAVAIYNWAEKRRAEEREEGIELNKGA